MRINPIKGTSDYLPKEAALREYIQEVILSVYKENGFERIMTPAVEDVENLDKSEGGENLNLIFKILKRGQKLEEALFSGAMDRLADLGLRYDLTLPLSRYYANNRQQLMTPFKCIQIDKVYRAERPQKGRSRELVQCDIDIIGSSSSNCEVELIHVTAKALLKLGLTRFKVKVNDRSLLREVFLSIGFEEGELSGVGIVLDKLAKEGVEGVVGELADKGYSHEKVRSLEAILSKQPLGLDSLKAILGQTEAIEKLEGLIGAVSVLAGGQYEVVYDFTLVRGQGYYTGPVFEIESTDFNSSIAGGGRYDNLIGKFINETVPAVGFSIGFERIYCILSDNQFKIPTEKKRVAVIYDKDFIEGEAAAEGFRKAYYVTLLERPKKLGKLISLLASQGYYGIYLCGKSEELEILK